MNREKAIRTFIYNQLDGNVTYESGQVPIHDAVLQDDANNVYVILDEQRANMLPNNCMNTWDCEIDLNVYSQQKQTVSKDVIDDISEQVENLLNAALAGGAEFEGWQFINFYLSSSFDRTFELLNNKSQVSKFMTFRLQATRL